MRMPRGREILLGLGLATGVAGFVAKEENNSDTGSTGYFDTGLETTEHIPTKYDDEVMVFFADDKFGTGSIIRETESRMLDNSDQIDPKERLKREKKLMEIKNGWIRIVEDFKKRYYKKQYSNSDSQLNKSFRALLGREQEPHRLVVKDLVLKYSALVGVPLDIAFSVLAVESQGDPFAKSPIKPAAEGLFQLRPGAAREMYLKVNKDRDERHDIERNIEAGLNYLKKMYKQFGSWDMALLAYNLGSYTIQNLICLAHKNIEHAIETNKYKDKKTGKMKSRSYRVFTKNGWGKYQDMLEKGDLNFVELYVFFQGKPADLTYPIKLAVIAEQIESIINGEALPVEEALGSNSQVVKK